MSNQGPEWWLQFAQVRSKQHAGVKSDDVLELFQQIPILLQAGTPLIEALEMAGRQSESRRLSRVMAEVVEQVSSGSSLSEALAIYPDLFSTRILSLVEVGETSGDMPGAMLRLRAVLKESQETTNQIISAAIYPAVLLTISVLCVVVMMWKVVPEFSTLFAAKGGKLPAITEAVISISNGIQEHGGKLVLCAVLTFLVLWQVLRTERGRWTFDVVVSVTPVVGGLYVQLAMMRFAQNLSLLLVSGTPLLEAIGVCRRIFEDTPLYHEALERTESAVSQGESLREALESTSLFTDLVLGMVSVGERTGQLPSVLEVAANYYKERVKILVHRVTGLMEPTIIVVMGCVMASIMAAIYIPMFDLSSGGAQ